MIIPSAPVPGSVSLSTDIIGFGLAGVATRCLQLAILGRPILVGPHIHTIYGAIGGIIGYGVHQWEIEAERKMAIQRLQLLRRRERRAAEEANGSQS